MKLVENLHHGNEVSGTTVILHGDKEIRAHWSEDSSDVVICDASGNTIATWEYFGDQINGAITDEEWKAIRLILDNDACVNARAMTQDEEESFNSAMGYEEDEDDD